MLPQDLDRLLTDEEQHELVRLLPRLARQARAAGLDDNTGELLKRLQIGRAVWEEAALLHRLDRHAPAGERGCGPCDTCHWVMGNIYRRGIREIWNSPAYRDFRRISRRPLGIMESGRHCVCDFCCHAVTNARVDRFLKWSAPVTAAFKGAN